MGRKEKYCSMSVGLWIYMRRVNILLKIAILIWKCILFASRLIRIMNLEFWLCYLKGKEMLKMSFLNRLAQRLGVCNIKGIKRRWLWISQKVLSQKLGSLGNCIIIIIRDLLQLFFLKLKILIVYKDSSLHWKNWMVYFEQTNEDSDLIIRKF